MKRPSTAAIEHVYPLSPLQRGMLFHEVYSQERSAYQEQIVFRLLGALDIQRMQGAFTDAIARHESLRSAFVWQSEKEQVAVVFRPDHVNLGVQCLDWSQEQRVEQVARLRRLLAEDHAKGYNLKRPPLARLYLVNLGEEQHYCVFSHHHLILDGWSLAILLKEILEHYETGQAPAPPCKETWARYRATLTSAKSNKEAVAWQTQLGQARVSTKLPETQIHSDASRGAQGIRLQLRPDQQKAWEEGAKRLRVTPSSLLQAAYALALGRATDQRRVALGVTVSGRPASLPGAEKLVGLLINTLPVIFELDPGQDAHAFVQDVAKRNLWLQEHQCASLSDLQKWVGQAPLFDTVVVYDNYPMQSLLDASKRVARQGQLQALALDPEELQALGAQAAQRNHYPLTLVAVPGQEQWWISASFDASRFSAQAVSSLLEGVVHFGSALVSKSRPLGQLDWQGQASAALPALQVDTVRDLSIADPERKDLPALVELGPNGQRSLSWGEFERAVARVRTRLMAQGLKIEDRVALDLDRSLEWVLCLLGIQSAGACAVLLDPGLALARKRALVSDSGACMVICEDAQEGLGVPSLVANELWASGVDAPLPMRPGISPDNLAYMIYTSGSTGMPKGVGITHGNWQAYAQGFLEASGVSSGLCYAWLSGAAVDLGHTSILGALASHGTLVVVHPDLAGDPDGLGRALAQTEIDVLKVAPTQLGALLEASSEPACLLPRRSLVCGGEAMSAKLYTQIRGLAPHLELVNHYGPTESTVGVCLQRACTAESLRCLGQAMPHAGVTVRDPWGQLSPLGLAGELWLSGASVARGYLGDPRKTAQCFVPDPDAVSPGQRAYRSGDKGTRNSQGVWFQGRMDRQLKIRGFRVEPAETEHWLKAQIGVQAAVVFAEPSQGKPRGLWAVILSGQPAPDLKALETKAKIELPAALSPLRIRILDEFPRLPSGKVDRQKCAELAAGAMDQEPLDSKIQEAQGPELQTLAKIWSAVLKREIQDSNANFFALGGDSILSLQVVARAKKVGLSLLPKDIFDHPTLGALARRVQEGVTTAKTPAQKALGTGRLALPCEHWLAAQELRDVEHFYQSLIIPLAQVPDPHALSSAFHTLARRHQKLAGDRSQDVDVIEIEAWCNASAKREISDHCQRAASNLGKKGRAGLRLICFVPATSFSCSEGQPQAWLAGLAHHRCVDAVSWQILLRELSRLMQGESLEPLPCDAQTFARRLHEKTKAGGFDHELAFWQAQTRAGLSPWKGSLNREFQEGGILLSVEHSKALRICLPQSHRASIQDALVTALVRALAKQGQPRCVVELEGHGRNWDEDLDASATVAWCTARYPLLFESGPDSKSTLCAVQNQMKQRPGDGTGYGALLYLSERRASLEATQGADLTLNYLGQVDRGDSGEIEQVRGVDARDLPNLGPARCLEWRPQVPLRVTASLRKEQLFVRLDADPRRWPATRFTALQRALRDELQALANAIVLDPPVRWHRRDLIGLATPPSLDAASLDELAAEYKGGPLGEVRDIYQAGPAQIALWLQDQKLQGKKDTAYWNQFLVAWPGIEPDLIVGAFRELARRHAALRTAFVSDTHAALLCVEFDAPCLPIHEISLAAGSHLQEEQAMMQYLQGRPLFETPVADAGVLPWELVLAKGARGRVWLAFRRHHILLDGWSTARLLAEFSALLQGDCAWQAGPDYRSYLAWRERQPVVASRRFWQEWLANAVPMPAQIGHCPGKTRQASAQRLACTAQVDPSVQDRLESLGASQGLTMNLWCQAAWARVLYLFSGREQVIFGIVDSGRDPSLPGSERIIGLLMQTLPMVVNWCPEQSLKALMDHLRVRNLELRQHASQGLEFEQRSLWQSLLVFENYPLQAQLGQALGGIESVRRIEQTHYPLTLSVDALDALHPGLKLCLRYDEGLYSESLAQGLLDTFLETLCALSKLDFTTPLDALSASRTPNPRPFPVTRGERGVMGKIMQVTARAPQATALVEPGGDKVSYGALMSGAQSIARALRERGIEAEQAVGICVGRGNAQVIATLGVVASGAYYVPIDVELVRARQLELCRCAGLAGLIYEGTQAPGLVQCEWSLASLQRQASGNVSTVHPAQLVYQIFTSGTTGRPKGVGVEQRQLLALVEPLLGRLELDARDTWTLFHRHAFDVSVWEMFGALCSGATLIVLDAAMSRDPARYAACLRDHRVSVASETPSAYYLLQDAIGQEPELCPQHLRHVLFAGEALETSRLHPRWPGPNKPVFWDLYGNTETTVHATLGRVGGLPHSVGRALPGSRVQLLGPNQEPVPSGAAGEIYISGQRISRGYLGEARLTAGAFVPDPAGAPGSRRYKTGDFATWGPREELYYLGRSDRQVQLRGFRIELSEVEARLTELCRGQRVRVEVLGQGPLAQLVAFVQDPNTSLDVQALFESAGEILPEYQRPARFVLLPRFATTPNGKLDRAWLLAQAQGQSAPREQPLSEHMHALTQLWQEVLQRGDIHAMPASRSFFALGGHSLLAVTMLNRLHRRFGLRIELGAFLADPTRAYLEARIKATKGSASPSAQDLLALLDEVQGEPS